MSIEDGTGVLTEEMVEQAAAQAVANFGTPDPTSIVWLQPMNFSYSRTTILVDPLDPPFWTSGFSSWYEDANAGGDQNTRAFLKTLRRLRILKKEHVEEAGKLIDGYSARSSKGVKRYLSRKRNPDWEPKLKKKLFQTGNAFLDKKNAKYNRRMIQKGKR